DGVESLYYANFGPSLARNQEEWVAKTRIQLLTVGPGKDLYAWFGHTALIVTQSNGVRIMYDWGIFDDTEEGFHRDFALGKMYYRVCVTDALWRIEDSIAEGREVRIVHLDLDPSAQFALIEFLYNEIGPAGRTYLYHFYDDNCATRVRDILDKATGGRFKAWAKSREGTSHRRTALPYMAHAPLLGLGLNFLQSWRIDEPTTLWDEMYLPETLHQAVLDFTFDDGRPLGINDTVLSEGPPPPANHDLLRADALFFFGLIASMVLIILGLHLPRFTSILYGLIFSALGLLGTLLFALMAGTNMNVSYWNLNILFINPLLFLVAFRPNRQGKVLLFGLGAMIVLLALKLLNAPFHQDSTLPIALLLPIYLSRAAFQGRAEIKQ
ncbi:MAG: DUF4105 domain-containing protein, partial [Spirochaetales bacterium]|nr:DUF4105 domain-containing protein [Spirochaetales bacterium]